MSLRKIISFFAFVLMGAGLVAVPAPAANAIVIDEWNYSGVTGATYINALGETVSSDLTAQSAIAGGPAGSAHNSTAAVNVLNLAKVGAVETRTTSSKGAGAIEINSWSRVAGVNLLNGLITIDAVESNVTTKGNADGTTSATADHKLLGIKILGLNLPVDIPKNYGVNIPGVAAISMNYTVHAGTYELAGTHSWALAVQLLEARDGFDAGTVIVLSPTNQYLQQAKPAADAPRLGGFAYSSRVEANVGSGISVLSNPTAMIGTPFNGSNNNTLRNSTATASVPGLLTLGTLTSTTTSRRDSTGNAEIVNTNRTVGLNLLAGLIKADAIDVTVTSKLENGVWTHTENMTTVNLVVAGAKIPINVGPNTVIDVVGLGKVEINKQGVLDAANQKINRIDGLKITLDTARAGLPVGAVIELAVAATVITTGD